MCFSACVRSYFLLCVNVFEAYVYFDFLLCVFIGHVYMYVWRRGVFQTCIHSYFPSHVSSKRAYFCFIYAHVRVCVSSPHRRSPTASGRSRQELEKKVDILDIIQRQTAMDVYTLMTGTLLWFICLPCTIFFLILCVVS